MVIILNIYTWEYMIQKLAWLATLLTMSLCILDPTYFDALSTPD